MGFLYYNKRKKKLQEASTRLRALGESAIMFLIPKPEVKKTESRFFALYDALLAEAQALCDEVRIEETLHDECWAGAAAGERMGLGMFTPGQGREALFPAGLCGLPAVQAAEAVKSWNLEEASFGLAALNLLFNTPARAKSLSSSAIAHYAEGIDFRGKKVGVVGHMKGVLRYAREAEWVRILERRSLPGDYPDSAAEWILPECDVVILSGSTLINKTLPRLLALSRNAFTVLTGPSVPLCPALFDFGVDRLAGLAVTDAPGLRRAIRQGSSGSPWEFGVGGIWEKGSQLDR